MSSAITDSILGALVIFALMYFQFHDVKKAIFAAILVVVILALALSNG